MREFIMAGFLILFAIYLVWQHFLFEWRNSLEKIQTERTKFIEYMKKLQIGNLDDVLKDYKGANDFKDANVRLRRCVK